MANEVENKVVETVAENASVIKDVVTKTGHPKLVMAGAFVGTIALAVVTYKVVETIRAEKATGEVIHIVKPEIKVDEDALKEDKDKASEEK